MPRIAILCLLLAVCMTACGESAPPKQPPGGPPNLDVKLDRPLEQRIEAALIKGRAYLAGLQQDSGAIGDARMPAEMLAGPTSMAVLGLIAATPRDVVKKDAQIRKAIEYLIQFQDETGALREKTGKTNYVTSVLVSALSLARISDYRKALVLARDYIEKSQIHEKQSDLSYGGFPYKQEQGQPADLSNGQYALEALHNAERDGLKADPAVWKRARKFLDRMQNRSESNTGSYPATKPDGSEVEVSAGNDGGAYYYPGESKAGLTKQADGTWVLNSYGSMTYALLKCLMFSGVKPDDPRVVAAVAWVQRNWTVEFNPGFEKESDRYQGYFYFLHTASRALAELERYTKKPLKVRDPQGVSHEWRAEMAEKILSMQAEDGSWSNRKSERWDESVPSLATGYMLQALAHISGRLP